MTELSRDHSKCYICDRNVGRCNTNISTTATKSTKTLISELLEQFSGHSLIRASNRSCCCSKCLRRINDYDLACFTARQVQKELTDLLSATDGKYSNSSLAGVTEDNEYVEDANNYDWSHSSDDIVPKASKKIEEPELVVVKREKGSSIDLDIETDEYEVHLYKVEEMNEEDENEIVSVIYPAQMKMDPIKTKSVSSANVKLESASHVQSDPSLPTRPPPAYCLPCERNFETKKLLREHKRIMHKKPPKTHPCSTCGAVFKAPSGLRIHQLTHTGETPFNCEICDKKFTQKNSLNRHMAMHTGECRYQCDKCGKQFIHYSSFQVHKMAHDDIRTKKCEICGRLLRSNSHLRQHMQTHSGLKPHKCPKCDKTFARNSNMMTHLLWHEGRSQSKRKHKCPLCAEAFTKKSSLEEHLMSGVSSVRLNMNLMELWQQLEES